MPDLSNTLAGTFVVWITSGVALMLLAWLAPVAWNRALRISLMLLAAAAAVLSTAGLFGVALGAASGLVATLAVYSGLMRG